MTTAPQPAPKSAAQTAAQTAEQTAAQTAPQPAAQTAGWTLDLARWPAAEAARHRSVLAIDAAGRALLLADRAPDLLLLQALESRLGQPLRWQQLPAAELAPWLAQAEGGARALDGLSGNAGPGADPGGSSAEVPELTLTGAGQAASPAVRWLDAVLFDALQDGASDIHIERTAQGAVIRLRIDGVMLGLRSTDDTALAEAMVSRLKVMAELDIGERRLPQDGRFRLRARGREVDFRLSIMPTLHGEDAVVRVLDRSGLQAESGGITLAQLGYPAELAAQVLALARAPHGLLLVTGPTGSGKTTTLYAAIGGTENGTAKLVTIEDPVEYALPGAAQVPVNEKQGLGFARGLRSILRHDPDRILVGEIRDAETAQIAVQAALTGHLVFSSVHANHALDVLGRFSHMGLDLYNLSAALNAVLAQRLLRRVCEACAVTHEPTAAQRQVLGSGGPLRRGRGCPACRGTGYRGRLAVAELLRLNDDLRELIVARASPSRIRQAAADAGMQPLHEMALQAVRAGQTTLDEVERVIAGH